MIDYFKIGIQFLQSDRMNNSIEAFRRSLFLEPKLWPAAWLLGDLLSADAPAAGRRYFLQAQKILESSERDEWELRLGHSSFEAVLPGRKVALEAVRAKLRMMEQAEL